MFQVKQNTGFYAPVRFYDTVTGAPTTGVLFSTLTITVEKGDGSTASVTVLAPSWTELVTGAFAGSGNYTYLFLSGVTNVVGRLRYAVSTSAPATTAVYTGVVDVVAQLASDITTSLGTPGITATIAGDIDAIYTRLGAPAHTTIAGDIANVDTDVGTVLSRIGTPVVTVSADIAAVKSDTGSTLTSVTEIATDTDTTLTRIGSPPGGFTDIFGVMGTPVHGSLAQDIAAGSGGGGGAGLPQLGLFKVGSSPKVLVMLTDTSGNPVTGKIASDLTVYVADVAGTITHVVGFSLTELTTGTFAGRGIYQLGGTLPAATVGPYILEVACTGATNFTAEYIISTYLWDDIKTDTLLARKVQTNRWKIFVTGPNANKLIVYDDDQTTPLLTFNLKDSAGAATFINPFERAP